MANITITLLTNKRTRQSIDGLDTIVAAQAGGYSVISGEDSSTTFAVRYPDTYIGQSGYVYMKNAKGEYAIKQFGELENADELFTLPASMTVEGNTMLVFYASTGSGDNLVKTVWAPVIVPITATSVDYEKVAVASPDTLAEVIATANLAIAKATAVETAAETGEFDGRSVFIRYSSNANGSGMTPTWTEGQRYIGVYVGMAASTQASDYTWCCFVGNTTCEQDSSTTAVALTVLDNTDKSYKATNITRVALTIPASAYHGFCAGVNVKNGSAPPTYSFTNNSGYDFKLIRYGTKVSSYTAKANTTTNLVFYCDGTNVYCYIQEV